jgi:hypothetical protein
VPAGRDFDIKENMTMRSIFSRFYRILLVSASVLTLLTGITACGAKASNDPLTVLSVAGGKVQVQKSGSGNWSDGKEGMTLGKGDRIKTESGNTAAVTFFDGSVIQLNGGTEISLDELIAKTASTTKTIKIGQKIGETTSKIVKLADPAAKYEISTASGVAAVRGSKMLVRVVNDGTTSVYNVEGSISFTAQGKEVAIPAGSGSTAKPGEAPGAPQPGLPAVIDFANATTIISTSGWQQTGLYLNTGDKYYVDYRGGSWTVDYKNFPYVGPGGYSADIDKTIAAGYKFDNTAPYACLLGKVGAGKEIAIGNDNGAFTADASGFLSLRINDQDASLGDNDGAISVNLRGPAVKPASDSLRQNPPYMDAPAANSPLAGTASVKPDGTVNVSLTTGKPSTNYQIFLEEYNGPVGGNGHYISWSQFGNIMTDASGKGTYAGRVSLTPGTHYFQIVLSTNSSWGVGAFGTDIWTVGVK